MLGLNTLPPKTARKWTNIALKPTKTRVSKREALGGGVGEEGGWGSFWVQASNQEVANCTEV